MQTNSVCGNTYSCEVQRTKNQEKKKKVAGKKLHVSQIVLMQPRSQPGLRNAGIVQSHLWRPRKKRVIFFLLSLRDVKDDEQIAECQGNVKWGEACITGGRVFVLNQNAFFDQENQRNLAPFSIFS